MSPWLLVRLSVAGNTVQSFSVKKDALTEDMSCMWGLSKRHRMRNPLWLTSTLKPTVATTLAIVLVDCFFTGALTVYAVFSIQRRPKPMQLAGPVPAHRADPIYTELDCYWYAELPNKSTEAVSRTTSIDTSRRCQRRAPIRWCTCTAVASMRCRRRSRHLCKLCILLTL